MTNPYSNPVGYLQEFVQKCNVAPFPTYVEGGAVGPAHSKLFTYQCIYHGFEVSATGSTKKQAKTEASKQMIKLLEENGYFEKYKHKVATAVIPEQNNLNVNIKTPPQSNKNPISILQEYCQQKKIELPKYTETGALSGGFSCECHCYNQRTVGLGACKKSSKTEAAHKMCKILNLINYPFRSFDIEINGVNTQDNVRSAYERVRPPPSVSEVTSTLDKLKITKDEPGDKTVIGATSETMTLNDSVVEIEPTSNRNEVVNVKIEDAVQCSKNYIALLQEYCQKYYTELPSYTEAGNLGGTYLCECSLGDKRTFGEDINKKSSKALAAFEMCKLLKLINSTGGHSNIEKNEDKPNKNNERLPVSEYKLEEFNLLNHDDEDDL